ncbi:MAG TPA: tRNA (adenosine(37)-N6)-threonylcarbamoyltransferase complex dimerization subunit type 1 TsaB, partial [bacterium]|nr:tRNA (adenosine(37)-N6)-threonylcarbamoyltransferase complex dimerization subunit type 1 TsaB [bacterium]
MKVLGIETSGGIGGFALVDDTQLVAEEVADIMGHHLERGSDMIESILTGAGLGVSDLEGIAVSLGPGSFTGLRVGLALAKGLAVGAGLALAGVPTLDAIAEGLREAEGMVVVVRDARRGEVYFAAYRAGVGGLARLGPYRALAPEAVAAELAQEGALLGSERPIVVAGDGLARYGDIFRRALGGRAAFAAEPL